MRTPESFKILMLEFKKADDRFLSKEDIRQDVLFDEYSRDGSIRQLIYEARKILKKRNLVASSEGRTQYEIITIFRKGFKLRKLRNKRRMDTDGRVPKLAGNERENCETSKSKRDNQQKKKKYLFHRT